MKRYRFLMESILPESLLHNKALLGLVALMHPIDIVTVLVKDFDLAPKAAAQAAGALISQASAGMQKEDPTDSIVGVEPIDIKISQFPPAPRKKNDDWPYDGATVNMMNAPSKRKRGLTN